MNGICIAVQEVVKIILDSGYGFKSGISGYERCKGEYITDLLLPHPPNSYRMILSFSS